MLTLPLKTKLPVGGVDAGGEAVVDGAAADERGDGVAAGDQGGAEHDGGLLADDLGGELHGDLRAGLVVVEGEVQRSVADRLVLGEDGFELLEGALFGLAEQGAGAGERDDDVDIVGVGGAGGRGDRGGGQEGDDREQASAHTTSLPGGSLAARDRHCVGCEAI